MLFELRYRLSKFHYEVKLRTNIASLAYGMRKKLTQEEPTTYGKKLIVKHIKQPLNK